MSVSFGHIEISWHTDIRDFERTEWNRLTAHHASPILDYEWLLQMELSGSVSPEAGWLPCHLAVRRESVLVAAAALYVKGHSQGEFVWDYVWADVASQLSVEYYPKLIGMSPATPAVGYRFLIDPEEDEIEFTRFMLDAIDALCNANKLSGVSFHFTDPEWGSLLPDSGYSPWLHQSFEWYNTGFRSFEDYLAGFNKNQRRNIRRERNSLVEAGVRIQTYSGDEITSQLLDVMWDYYERTNDQFGPWAAKYLTREFFDKDLLTFKHRLLLAAAYIDDDLRPVALSMLLHKDEVIIGRYWGADRMVDNLHFELCYYTPIEWAINNNVGRFDPGAGSSHKLRRGFLAVGNYSYHRFANDRFRQVMEMHIDEINENEIERIESMTRTVPLKSIPQVPSMLAGVTPSRW